MFEYTTIDLRAYLKKTGSSQIREFEDFLECVDKIYKLRLEAERFFKDNPHIAKSRFGALPLDWENIGKILFPPQDTPPESLITQISRDCLKEVEEIIQDLHKVLIRERAKIPIGKVQQIDSHCLRWLTIQPGREPTEKAGVKQRILAVVRNENYNTLENRVFKDFLIRVKNAVSVYIQKNGKKYADSRTIKDADKLRRLCVRGLRELVMESVGSIHELPIPNYVLRQERRYSKIWKAYCELIKQADVAIRLWEQRKELLETYKKMCYETERRKDQFAKYKHYLWINQLDGKKELFDQPCYSYEISTIPIKKTLLPKQDQVVIDLTGNPYRDLLVYCKHDNAKPFLQDYSMPLIEEDVLDNGYWPLHRIFSEKNSEKLSDYFEQLYALVGGKRWIVLVPDGWDALWQETVIKAIPLARNNVFLLWRSISAVLGAYNDLENPKEGDTVSVIDVQQDGLVRLSKLILTWDNDHIALIPQRKSYERHKECYCNVTMKMDESYLTLQDMFIDGEKNTYCLDYQTLLKINMFTKNSRHIIFVNNINGLKDYCGEEPFQNKKWIKGEAALLRIGVDQFIDKRDKGLIPYFDELEELALIVQTPDEKIFPKVLVKANDRSPGGEEQTTDTICNAAVLKKGNDKVSFYLRMGEDKKLKLKEHKFESNLNEDHKIDLSARVMPGQGMAIVTVTSDFMQYPIELDFLHGMKDATVFELEKNMKRSFPPVSLEVWSETDLWNLIEKDVKEYIDGERNPDGSWFAKAKKTHPWGVPFGMSPLEKFRRSNVFGNDIDKSLPKARFDFDALFKKLAKDYYNPEMKKDVTRLIAWTYQGNRDDFCEIVKETAQNILQFVSGGQNSRLPQTQEYTLCANLSSDVKTWKICLAAVMIRIKNINDTKTNLNDYFRMLCNLLQFHSTIIKDTGIYKSDLCWLWVQHFPYWYNFKHDSPIIGYILKSLLYFLRCRNFDGKVFLTKDRDAKHYKIISKMLEKHVNKRYEGIRRTVIEYLNGAGTIDGLPDDIPCD